MSKQWKVYLAGEIHSDWRDRIVSAATERDLPVSFTAPVTDHAASDNCGVDILGPEDSSFWKDHKGAKINAIPDADAHWRCRRGGCALRRQLPAVERGVRRGLRRRPRQTHCRDPRRGNRPRAQGSRLGGAGGGRDTGTGGGRTRLRDPGELNGVFRNWFFPASAEPPHQKTP